MMPQYDANLESDYNKTSKINSAGLINLRMNKLWGIADMCSVKADVKNWYLVLDTIWGNLAADIVEKDKDKIKDYDNINKELTDKGFFNIYKQPKGFERQDNKLIENRHFYFRKLRELQIFLTKLENAQGKGTAYRDPYDDDFD